VTASTAVSNNPPRVKQRPGDRVFAATTRAAGYVILIALAGVAIFLTAKGLPALGADRNDLAGAANLAAYVWPLLFGTLLAALLAILIATPLALGVALVISHYAPRRLASPLGYVVDLLAAIPSVVYGLWGLAFLGPRLFPVYDWLADNLGFIPFFRGPASASGRTILTAAIVLAIMILPIITAITREIFTQTPRLHQEAALALGATRWEMLRLAVFPYGRSGIVSAVMLGLGRALGETMAVLMILSPGFLYSFKLLEAGQQQTIAANIAAQFPEANPLGVSALIATGLALFVITLVVNMAARAIVARRKEFSGAN
jgi:phosphate transport system permease protein